jgi:hypothetical protein
MKTMLRFLLGLTLGTTLGLALFLWPGQPPQQLLARADGLWQLARLNLQGSVPLFALVASLYGYRLWRLYRELLRLHPSPALALRHEQVLDLCASLFFGIGVIWTAIGMRGALLFALGDELGDGQALAVLERLVDGGILLALSTTIVGGIGGYLMRALKSLLLGGRLTALYLRESHRPVEDSLATLRRIEARLDANAPPVAP